MPAMPPLKSLGAHTFVLLLLIDTCCRGSLFANKERRCDVPFHNFFIDLAEYFSSIV